MSRARTLRDIRRRRSLRSDAAMSEVMGTILMVGLVVAAGGGLAAIVTTNLATATAPVASFGLAPVAAGDTTLTVILRSGDDLPLDDLAMLLRRDNGGNFAVAPGTWTTPDPENWRVGDRVTFPLSPPAGGAERLEVRVTLSDGTNTLASLSSRTASAAASLGNATLAALLAPSAVHADGVSATRLTVRVTHPLGASTIARVDANLANITTAAQTADATLALADTGLDGDTVGGDGVWSGLIRAPALTTPGNYTIPVTATDLSGRVAGTAAVVVWITSNITLLPANTTGNDTNVTGGTCYGCVISGGSSSYEGTRLVAPTSANVTGFRLRNWTWDKLNPTALNDDALVFRIVNGSAAWSMYFRFGYVSNTPCITYMRAWTGSNETIYGPKNGTCVPLTNLNFNVLDPVAEQQMVRTSGNTNPHSMYRAAGLEGNTTFILAYLRDEDPTGQLEQSQQIGVFSMDVVMS